MNRLKPIDVDKFENLVEMGYRLQAFDADVWKIAFEERVPESPCFMFKNEKGGTLQKVEELGYNKLALGHHLTILS